MTMSHLGQNLHGDRQTIDQQSVPDCGAIAAIAVAMRYAQDTNSLYNSHHDPHQFEKLKCRKIPR